MIRTELLDLYWETASAKYGYRETPEDNISSAKIQQYSLLSMKRNHHRHPFVPKILFSTVSNPPALVRTPYGCAHHKYIPSRLLSSAWSRTILIANWSVAYVDSPIMSLELTSLARAFSHTSSLPTGKPWQRNRIRTQISVEEDLHATKRGIPENDQHIWTRLACRTWKNDNKQNTFSRKRHTKRKQRTRIEENQRVIEKRDFSITEPTLTPCNEILIENVQRLKHDQTEPLTKNSKAMSHLR